MFRYFCAFIGKPSFLFHSHALSIFASSLSRSLSLSLSLYSDRIYGVCDVIDVLLSYGLLLLLVVVVAAALLQPLSTKEFVLLIFVGFCIVRAAFDVLHRIWCRHIISTNHFIWKSAMRMCKFFFIVQHFALKLCCCAMVNMKEWKKMCILCGCFVAIHLLQSYSITHILSLKYRISRDSAVCYLWTSIFLSLAVLRQCRLYLHRLCTAALPHTRSHTHIRWTLLI